MDHRWWLLQPRRRPEPAAIDITWVSCRGVRSSVPFHTPCLYASIYLHHPSSSSSCGRRPHRVKTATDRTGGGNPEWDAPLRLYYLPSSSSSSSSSGEREAAPAAASPPASDDNKEEEEEDDCRRLLLRFELKSEVAVIGDVISATAAVPVSELVADGRTRRVSYQLAGPDGKHPNGVISFSYAFHAADTSSSSSPSSDADDDRRSTTTTTTSSSGSECEYSITPPWSAASRAITLPPPPSSSTMYPAIDWPPTEQVIPMLLYPPAKPHITAVVKGSTCYPPPPPPTPPVEPVAVFAPPSPACGVYYPPTVREPVSSSGMYPKVDLDIPVSCYPPPPTATMYGGGCGYAAAPELDGRFLHG